MYSNGSKQGKKNYGIKDFYRLCFFCLFCLFVLIFSRNLNLHVLFLVQFERIGKSIPFCTNIENYVLFPHPGLGAAPVREMQNFEKKTPKFG